MMEFDKKGGEAARAAWLYYHEDLTQGDVARELGVSRSTVTRLLQRAKAEGLVQISLNVSSDVFKAERGIERAFGVDKVRIVQATDEEAQQKRWLGAVAAEALIEMVSDKTIVAVSWGTTMQAMADALIGQRPLNAVEIVALIGGLHNASRGTNTYEVAKQLAQYFNAQASALHAPVYVRDEATALGLASDPGIREVFALARKASIVVYSIGSMHVGNTISQLGYVTTEQKTFLSERGAVADIACRWIDRNGDAVALPASINPVGITLDELKAIPQRLAVAGGEAKHQAILASLRGGYVTHLVTDQRTAEFLLRAA
jgi:DNA-binding transcriptional regulator LsrR (DeoR family)